MKRVQVVMRWVYGSMPIETLKTNEDVDLWCTVVVLVVMPAVSVAAIVAVVVVVATIALIVAPLVEAIVAAIVAEVVDLKLAAIRKMNVHKEEVWSPKINLTIVMIVPPPQIIGVTNVQKNAAIIVITRKKLSFPTPQPCKTELWKTNV